VSQITLSASLCTAERMRISGRALHLTCSVMAGMRVVKLCAPIFSDMSLCEAISPSIRVAILRTRLDVGGAGVTAHQLDANDLPALSRSVAGAGARWTG
jgi:hypothetical protein